jgi:drug/metabolite transporter (DMT)-like permease
MLYLISSIILGAAGHIFAKIASIDLKNIVGLLMVPQFYAAVSCYGLSFVLWMFFLRNKPLSAVVPLNALTYVVVVIASYFIFGDKLRVTQYVGIAAVIFGVMLIEG